MTSGSLAVLQQSLVSMANQIGDFFRYQGDEDAARQGIAAHLHHFWAPSMRRDLVAWLDARDGEGLTPLVREAVAAHRGLLLNPRARVPGENALLESPPGGGDAG